jgi:hypothetical protein
MMSWIPLDELFEEAKAGGYRVPSPAELRKKLEKQRKKKAAKPKKPKPPQQKKSKNKKRGGVGRVKKKPPQQKSRPGGSQAKAKVDQVPAQLMHCVNAVKDGKPSSKGGKPGKKHSVRAAWNICRWSLTRNGYLKPPYKKNAKLTSIRQTQKGSRRTMKHAMEPEGGAKYKRFKDLFRDIEPTV